MQHDKTFGFTTQQVRLMDVFIVTPFLLWASTKTTNKTAKYGLLTLGLLTFAYNGFNYIRNQKKDK
jgi:hypothetical protein